MHAEHSVEFKATRANCNPIRANLNPTHANLNPTRANLYPTCARATATARPRASARTGARTSDVNLLFDARPAFLFVSIRVQLFPAAVKGLI